MSNPNMTPVCVPARWLCIGDTIVTSDQKRLRVAELTYMPPQVELRLQHPRTCVVGRPFRVPETCRFLRAAA